MQTMGGGGGGGEKEKEVLCVVNNRTPPPPPQGKELHTLSTKHSDIITDTTGKLMEDDKVEERIRGSRESKKNN